MSYSDTKIKNKENAGGGKRVLVLLGSPRRGGNSELLAAELARGAAETGHSVETVRIAEKRIGYCRACYYCRDHGGRCAIADDMAELLDSIIAADVLVLATPVYFYSLSAQLKTVIDRTVARWTEVRDKDMYYIITAADEEREAADATLAALRGYADCIEGARECGVVLGMGAYERGEIATHPQMGEAYELGRRI